MKSGSLRKIDKELETLDERIAREEEKKKQKIKTRKKLLRKERDHIKHIIGGMIMQEKEKYAGLLLELYEEAKTRDKVWFVRHDLVEGNEEDLVQQNKRECEDEVQRLEAAGKLSEKDQKDLDIVLSAFRNPTKKLTRKVYGRKGEIHVYIGQNVKHYISDELAAYLKDFEGFNRKG